LGEGKDLPKPDGNLSVALSQAPAARSKTRGHYVECVLCLFA